MTLEDEELCEHVVGPVTVEPSDAGCHECLQIGGEWLHLRMCLACGHVGCCDQSPNRHATAHFHEIGHPAIQSVEPGEDWRWCYTDEVYAEGPSAG